MSSPSPKKSLGQHWLEDEVTLASICSAADVGTADTVLEIGPGLGTLTRVLAAKAGQVIAVEVDRNLAAGLSERVNTKNLRIVQSDILSFDLTSLPPGYKVVANIPYYLTSNLIRVLSESSSPPDVAVLLVQKEVAERVAARPGSMSLLSVTAQFYWEISLGAVVPAELFIPPPKVDSQVIIMRYRPSPLFTDVDANKFFRLVKAGFAQRRKTLLNSLSAGLHLDRPTAQNYLEKAGIDPGRRAQTLSLDEWHRLYTII